MITEATIRRIEAKTAAYRKDTIERLGPGMPVDYFKAWVHGFEIGCDGVEEPYQTMMQDQLRIEEVKKNMKAKKKGMTKNQKLKSLKTSKAKKMVKATKK